MFYFIIMGQLYSFNLFLNLFFLHNPTIFAYQLETQTFDLSLPDVTPDKHSNYVCTPVKLNPFKTYYIVGYEPKASMDTIHHMILYGCGKPGESETTWNCGEMSVNKNDISVAGPCSEDSTILYAWARDAPELKLPQDVAFKVGMNTKINYLVLQVHYKHEGQDKTMSSPGLRLNYVETPMPKLAGVILLGTGGQIQKHSLESMEVQCTIEEDKIMHPFAFRVHTHELGVRVAGYQIVRGKYSDYWTLIGEKDPLLPEMFYPVDDPGIIIQRGDSIAVSCKMDATRRNHTTYVGNSGDDEMCNFYIMYWVEAHIKPLELQYCFSEGPPIYYWHMDLLNIPFKEHLYWYRNSSP